MNNLLRYISFAASVIAYVCFVSCDTDQTTSIGGKDTAYFPIGNNVEIHPLGDMLNVSFTSGVDWYVEISPKEHPWLDISLTQNTYKKGTTQFNISADPYKGVKNDDVNEALMTFYSTSREVLHTVTIHQQPAYIDITQEAGTTGDFEWHSEGTKGSRTYRVSSNIHWTCHFEDDDIFYSSVDSGGNLGGEYKDMVIQAVDVNLGTEPLSTQLTFCAVKKNGNETTVIDEVFRTMQLEQDNLIFDVPSEFPSVGELGNYSLNSNQDYSDPYRVQVDVFTETDYILQWRMEGDDEVKGIYEGEPWFYADYERGYGLPRNDVLFVEVPEANPDTVSRVAIIRLVSVLNDRAYREIKVSQNPYTWDITIGELSADEASSTTIQINTQGPWSITKPSNAGWWETDENTWSGEGPKTIEINSTDWNLDTKKSYEATFEISSGCNELTKSLILIKDRFHFDIANNMVNDLETVKSILSELRKKDLTLYPVEVDCSGPWSCKFVDKVGLDSNWVYIDNESGTNEIKLGAKSVNGSNMDREAKIVFTSHVHKKFGETLTETLTLKQLKHVFGWEVDDWGSEIRNQYLNQPAYVGIGAAFGFSTTFSDEWQMESDQPWVLLNMENSAPNQRLSGNGEGQYEKYVYVTVADNFNTASGNRTATITVYDKFKGDKKSFTISQAPFVFNVSCSSSYNVGPFDADMKTFDVNISKDAPWTVQVTDPGSLLREYTQSGVGTGSNETFTFTTNAVSDINMGDRTATVKISVDGSNLSKTFKVVQSEYAFRTLSDPTVFHEVDIKAQRILIDCYKDNWEVSSSARWIDAVKDGAYLKLTPKEINTNLSNSNTGEVIITTPFDGNAKAIRLNVEQSNYKFGVSAEKLDFEPLDAATKKQSITVDASAGWDFKKLSEFTASKGNNKIEISVKSENYDTDSSKSETLTVESDHGHTKTVVITQKPYVFSVDEFKDKSITSAEQTISFENLLCTGKLNVKIESKATWLTVYTDMQDGKIVLKATANTDKTATVRTAKVTLSSEHKAHNAKLSKEITITQDK